MKLRIICLICCFSLLLSGCRTASAVRNVLEGSSSSEASSQGREIPLSSSLSDAEAGDTPTIPEAIIDNAPLGCGFAVVRMPERYPELPKPTREFDLSAQFGGAQLDTVVIIPFIDGMELNISLSESDTVLHSFRAELGECYLLKTFLSEGIPAVYVSANYEDDHWIWYSSYDGYGEMEVEYVMSSIYGMGGDFEDGSFYYSPYVWAIAVAPSVIDKLTGNWEEYLWETVAYAISLVEDRSAYNEAGFITLHEDIVNSYIESLYPNATGWPPVNDDFADYFLYDSATSSYTIGYMDFGNTVIWEIIEYISNELDDGGNVWVGVTDIDSGSYEAYDIVFAAKSPMDENDIIPFMATGIGILEAVG